jgi:hypothetical protein
LMFDAFLRNVIDDDSTGNFGHHPA